MNHKNYLPDANLLENKIIAITGAGDGIGKQAALTFAAHGATVILIGRTVPKLEQVYDQIVDAKFPEPAICPLDLESAGEEQYQTLKNAIDEDFGRLDGLLHNAAMLGPRTPIANYAAAEWEKVMRVNINAEFMLTQALLPLLERALSASIVFTTSSVGRIGRAFWGAYAVSKFAVEGFAQVLAEELDATTNIRVNCINPGATRTKMRASAYPAEDPGNLKTAESIMVSYLYLMGDDSTAVNGQSLDA